MTQQFGCIQVKFSILKILKPIVHHLPFLLPSQANLLKPAFWRLRRLVCLALVGGLLGGLLVLHPIQAQPRSLAPLRVATRTIPPFVMQQGKQLSGFSIELWNQMAVAMGVKSEFQMYPTVKELLAAIATGKADLGIAAISITAEREQQFDFSYPILAAGLQIMVRHPEHDQNAASNFFRTIFSVTLLRLVGIALLLIVVAAHVIWLFERQHTSGIIARSYIPGIFEAGWWSAATLATQADQMPKGPIGRIIAILWMFIGVLFVAYFTATVTTSMTVQQLHGDIRGLEDLSGRIVATTANSTAAQFLRDRPIETLEFSNIEEAYAALLGNKADAVVFDSPVLLYYAANAGRGKVHMVDGIFREENYGIALPKDSPHREPINAALLRLKESNTYQLLYDQWFKAQSE